MTIKHSPLRKLKAQADKIAAVLKAAERGEKVESVFAAKIAEARQKPSFKAGIVMDDKIITIELPWTTVAATTEGELSEFIVRQMRELRHAV